MNPEAAPTDKSRIRLLSGIRPHRKRPAPSAAYSAPMASIIRAADRRRREYSAFSPAYHFRGILRLHETDMRICSEERTGLVDGHIVCPHLPYVLYPLTRQGHQILPDAEKQSVESVALDRLNILFQRHGSRPRPVAAPEQPRRLFVGTARITLYCNPLHIITSILCRQERLFCNRAA